MTYMQKITKKWLFLEYFHSLLSLISSTALQLYSSTALIVLKKEIF